MKKNKFLLRYAMETYGLKVMLSGSLTPTYVANRVLDRVNRACRKQDAGEADEVGCSMGMTEQIGSLQQFNVYIHFSMPPVPSAALQIIGSCFKEFDLVTLEMINPFGKPECGLKDSSHALRVIKDNQSQIMHNVTEGRRFYLVKTDHPKYGNNDL